MENKTMEKIKEFLSENREMNVFNFNEAMNLLWQVRMEKNLYYKDQNFDIKISNYLKNEETLDELHFKEKIKYCFGSFAKKCKTFFEVLKYLFKK